MSAAPLPCVIGVSTITDKAGKYSTPSQFFTDLLRQALKDAGLDANQQQLGNLVTDIAAIRMQPENMGISYSNLAYQVARNAGLDNAEMRCYYTSNGGDSPQKLVNYFSKKIAAGESKICILLGGELLDTFLREAKKKQSFPEWGSEYEEDDVTRAKECQAFGNFTAECNELEMKNGLTFPKEMYAMMDQAARLSPNGSVATSFQAARAENAKLFDALNKVAAAQPQGVSWFPTRRDAAEIATPSNKNRWVAFPYTKYMNSVIQVNQGACVILAPSSLLPQLQQRPIFVRGVGECIEPGFCVSQRPQLGKSFGMMESIDAALKHAGVRSAKHEIEEFDLYSCFPVAIRNAREHLGLEDYSKLTVTGGLPFYGGPGNAYTLCAIAEMTRKLRGKQRDNVLGLVNGNGWFMTKHACGIYSNSPVAGGKWPAPEDSAVTQAKADARAGPLVEQELNPADGALGRIEAYIVLPAEKKKPLRVQAFGRLQQGSGNKRFLATCVDAEAVKNFIERDGLNLLVRVSTPQKEGANVFMVEDKTQWEKCASTAVSASTFEAKAASKL